MSHDGASMYLPEDESEILQQKLQHMILNMCSVILVKTPTEPHNNNAEICYISVKENPIFYAPVLPGTTHI